MALLPSLGSAVTVVLSQLWNPLVLHLGYPLKIRGNIKKLTTFMKRLKSRRDDIKTQLEIAERRRKACKHEVKEWLQRVEAIEGEVKAIKDAYNKRCRCRGEFSLDIIANHRISKRAAKKLEEVIELYDRGAFEEIAVELPPPPIEEKPISNAVIRMQSNLQNVLRYLKDEKVGLVGVWGMGGVGKTTLLKTINNHLLADSESFCYDHVICIAASKGCKLENLQMEIAEKIGLYLKQDSRITSRTSAIFSFLKNRKFLLLLDDLWEPIDLAGVGIPQPNGPGSQKIVLATRFEEVCGNMGAHTKIKLECLEPDEAWELFKDNVSEETINSDVRIRYLARKVCEECSGLPLALITIGRSMSTRRTLQEWENAIALLENKRRWETSGMKDVHPVLSTLKFSYDSLEDEAMKECFLTCSLWPEGYSIWNVELVDCWMGLGLQPIHNSVEETYNEGFSRIESLKRACLLENGDISDKEVRLHDVIRDMALWIVAGNAEKLNWIVQSGLGLNRVTNDHTGRWATTSRISLMCNYIQALPQSPNCPNLSLLMLQQNFHLKLIPPSLFQSMSALAYLDLCWTPIKELPREICSLVKLQFLNLSKSDISSLPVELGGLTQLRFLDLSYTNCLEKIPGGVISRLSMLQVFNLFQSKYAGFERELHQHRMAEIRPDMVDNPHVRNENSEFAIEELHCLDRGLKALGISVRTVKSLQMLSELSNIYLYLLGLYKLEGEPSLCLKLRSSIKVLNIKNCLSLEELSIENESDGHPGRNFVRLEFLTLWRLPKLKSVSLAEHLSKLRRLVIVENNDLTDITWIAKMPFLEHLDLSFCNGLKQVVGGYIQDGENSNEMIAFSRLRIIQMNHLPRLERFCNHKFAFPSLVYVDVFGCPLLKQLPFESEAKNIRGLRRIRGEKEWWDRLEWGDNGTMRLSSVPFFRVFENNLENFEPDLDTNPFMSSASSFFTRRGPMVRTALQFSAYLSSVFGAYMLLE